MIIIRITSDKKHWAEFYRGDIEVVLDRIKSLLADESIVDVTIQKCKQ